MPTKGSTLETAFNAYIVQENIGDGGSGSVYRVIDSTSTLYAAKVLRTGFSKQKLKRFQNEMMFCSRKEHLNWIKVLDQGLSPEKEPFYVMPLASSTLRTVIEKGIVDDQVLPIFSEILDGAEAAHLMGVVHRDYKPENILLDSTGTVKIADFGIAHFEEEELHTQVVTTPTDRLANWAYAAPEQRRIGSEVDKRADIYALGLILAEMFTGVVPHGLGGVRIADRSARYSYLDELVAQMRQDDPSARPQTIRKVKEILIGRRNDFVETQRLDALKKTVIRDSEVSDVLVDSPMEIVDFDFTGSHLQFVLSADPNKLWQECFYNMNSYTSVMGHGPEQFVFRQRDAIVTAPEYVAQQVINNFKQYVLTTNQMYVTRVRAEAKRKIDNERASLAAKIMSEESRRQVKARLKL